MGFSFKKYTRGKPRSKVKVSYDPQNLSYKPLNWWGRNRTLVVVLISSLIIMSVFALQETIIKKYIVEGETVSTIIIPQPKFSQELLIDYIEELNIKFPEIVYAQAVIETGTFTSTIFKENHNLFGMKCAKNRCYTHLGGSRGHAQYANWKMSVLDYALYQSSYLRAIKTKEEYYAYLGNHYAEDPNYVKKVKRIVNKLNYK